VPVLTTSDEATPWSLRDALKPAPITINSDAPTKVLASFL
jgi:hypothetical protein